MPKVLTLRGKQNRRKPTPAELELKKQLQRWKIKFRSQRPFDWYIVDFVIPERRLIVEVDGAYHSTEKQRAYDEKRAKYLESLGNTVVRFTNDEVLKTDGSRIRDTILSFPVVETANWRDAYGKSKF